MFENLTVPQPKAIGGPSEADQTPVAADDSTQPLLPGMDVPPRFVEAPEPELNPATAPSFQTEPPPNELPTETAELADWKAALRSDFEKWLDNIDAIPVADSEEAPEMPDLCSFYEQLSAASVETRKANRRTAEAFSQWAETLARFESQLAPLRESTAQLAAVQPRENELPGAYCLVLAEFLDRMSRLAKAFESSPAKKSWWGGTDADWRRAWEAQRQGFAILVSHFEELLKKEGLTRIEVVGQPFDPTVMAAVAVEQDSSRPAQTVLEEIAPGYRRRGQLLRPAQVKVSARP
jgi:molecular chaperone GrpE (heat shock protein)